MEIKKIPLILVSIELTLIVLGGFVYSLIPICDNVIDHHINCNYTRPSMSDSIFFIITTITTIGYGNLTPTLDEGKIFTIIVAFIGIPINIIFLAKIGEIFKKLSTFLLKPVKKISKDKQIFIITQIICSVITGTIMFLLLPGLVIMSLENWSYIDALYYIFVTLFTIGFGDLVAGSSLKMSSIWMNLYRFLLYLWMYLGMAFISLIITLVLDYFKANAENIRKEVVHMIEEKINLTIRQYLSSRKNQLRFRKKNYRDEKIRQGLRIKINYQEDKLEEFARRRSSKFKTSLNLKAYFNQYFQDNKAYNQDEHDNKDFDADRFYAIEEKEEIDDEFLKIDIEKCDYSETSEESNVFNNDNYDTVTSEDYLNTNSFSDKKNTNQYQDIQCIFDNKQSNINNVKFY